MRALDRLLRQHEALEAQLAAHLAALVGCNVERARVGLEGLASQLRHHLAIEEQLLMPLYTVQGGTSGGVSAEVFRAEHRRLEALLSGLEAQLQALPAEPAAVVAYLEAAFRFKHLLEHHDRREENMLYPWLAAQAASSGTALEEALQAALDDRRPTLSGPHPTAP